ncbi:MarR family winged helix-turn-helix transcriptional regulator [Desulfocurvibacter africanus]|uniref:Transcriptional regulator, MarR family n=1 Tax=Desulfocurvibacter africanus subsp. africanus str. Walvis Bay TaxID=690850 RepID=F3YUA3_DESAF|nr:MarR family transcriptional regulator [Desulfocurvibacter africanus]EGJ48709.1 transcriptional regulator, MarR family [Desulfocurvibacter africanus subsp. africanus str. Walvis Bay]
MHNGLNPDEMDKSVGFKVVKLALRMKQELRRAFLAAGLDVTPEQWAVMNKLYLAEGLSQSELADQVCKDRPTITRILDTLERRGLVVRGRDHTDRRRYRVHLTMTGSEMRGKLYPVTKGLGDKLISGLDAEEIARFKASLEILLKNLE